MAIFWNIFGTYNKEQGFTLSPMTTLVYFFSKQTNNTHTFKKNKFHLKYYSILSFTIDSQNKTRGRQLEHLKNGQKV